jgi:hypothetical protein
MRGWQWYGTKTLQVVPYMPGTPVYRDGMLPFLYTKLKEDGNVAATFCGENKTMDEFVSYFHRIKTMQVLCTVGSPEDPNKLTAVGFSWVDNPRGVDGQRVAMPGEAFFKGSVRVSRYLAKLSLAYVMHDMRVDIFHGVQVASNFAAKNFAIRCGFRECAIIPNYHFVNGQLEDARVMILEAKEYLPKFFKWKEAIDLEEKSVEMSSVIA